MFHHEILNRLLDREHLTSDESDSLMNAIITGKITQLQIAAILAALRMKGETVQEITGFARAMRRNVIRVLPSRDGLVDTCGTGGDARQTFNISTAVAIVTSATGIPIAKHGNRAVSSKCGSADVLEKLGVAIDLSPPSVAELIDETGIGFLFAPTHHRSMKHVAQVRRELGIRTIFNLLGPLTNPAGVKRQLIGVFREDLTEIVVRVLMALGSEKVFAVYGRDGTDEISITDETVVSVLDNGSVRTFTFVPEEAGLKRAKLSDINGGTPDENAALIQNILKGDRGPQRDVVVLNCAFAALAADRVDNVVEGVRLAEEAIDSRRALRVLEKLCSASQSIRQQELEGGYRK